MKQVLDFLNELRENNNREWFLAHKQQYLDAKRLFDDFALDLADRIRAFDDTIGPVSLNDMTWRIYRDVRFSRNKAPYKCHMGVYVCRGGKKSGYSGYYFHVSADDEGGWETGHLMASGNYFMEPAVLRILREDILYGNGEFRKILSEADPRMKLETADALKKVPKGFPEGTPDSEFYKLKNFGLSCTLDDAFVMKKNLAANLAKIFKTTKPFLDFINRAIEFSRE